MYAVHITATALEQCERAWFFNQRIFLQMRRQLEQDPSLDGGHCRKFDPARYATGLGIEFGPDVRGVSWWRSGITMDYLYSASAQVVVVLRVAVDKVPMM